MPTDIRLTEQRQHLNLSSHALSVLEHDMDVFLGENNKSGFINHIISNFLEDSEASISLMVKRFREESANALGAEQYKDLPAEKKETIDLIAKKLAESTAERMHSFAKSSSPLKIRLQNEVYDELYPSDNPYRFSEDEYYNTQGEYIKALFEDYASKPFFDREAIYSAETIKKLKGEIERTDKVIFRISYRNTRNQLVRLDIKPYRLSGSSEGEYNYCICCAKEAGSDTHDYEPRLLRISRIEKIDEHKKSFGSGKITELKKKEIEKVINEKGISFFSTKEARTYRILLTKKGWDMYHVILHNRPLAVNIEEQPDDTRILTFEGGDMQIRTYFDRFGADAIVIEPKELHQYFADYYRKAAKAYDPAENPSEK